MPVVLTDPAATATATAAVVAAVEAEHGRLDAAHLNAGISAVTSGAELDLEDFARVIAVDLFGVVDGTEAVRPALRRAGGGAVVVTASLAGLAPMPSDPAYSVAKGGTVAFVRSMAPRLAAEGIPFRRCALGSTPRSSTRSGGRSPMPAPGADRR